MFLKFSFTTIMLKPIRYIEHFVWLLISVLFTGNNKYCKVLIITYSSIVLDLSYVQGAVGHLSQVTTHCEYYNNTCNGPGQSCNDVEECGHPSEGQQNHCYVLWSLSEDGIAKVSLKVIKIINSKNFENVERK